MIYKLYINKRSKSTGDLIKRYLLIKGLIEKKLKSLYKVRLRHFKLPAELELLAS